MIKTDTQQRRMALPRQVACTPITPTLTRTQCTSRTEVVHVVGCGVTEICEESGFARSKSTPANSCVGRHVLNRRTTVCDECRGVGDIPKRQTTACLTIPTT